jgi:hypothetical protein
MKTASEDIVPVPVEKFEAGPGWTLFFYKTYLQEFTMTTAVITRK